MISTLCQIAGLIICGLVAGQMALYFYRSFRGLAATQRANMLREEQLRTDIQRLRQKHVQQAASTEGWEGYRKFRVDRKVAECNGCHSIYLVPHDGKTLPSYQPGQYLTFNLKIPGQDKPIVRCYSLSDAPGKDYFRCTIKQALPPRDKPELPPGKSSTYMNEVVKEGDILDVKAPRGTFYLDPTSDRAVVLLAGGVGVTPMMSMLQHLCGTKSPRKVIFHFGITNSSDHIFKRDLAAIATNHPEIEVVNYYSKPLESDVDGRDYQGSGYVSIDRIKTSLGDAPAEFYLCGPGPFMQSMTEGLIAAGYPEYLINTEAFGPSSVKSVKKKVPAATTDTAKPIEVKFARSAKSVIWDPSCTSILEFAEAQGIDVESGCRAGNCGTCAIAVKNGDVSYIEDAGCDIEGGTCLPCIAVPTESMTLDA